MQVYLAGPQVFTPQGEQFVRDRIIPALEENGYDPLYPSDTDDDDDGGASSVGETLARPVSVERAEELNQWGMEVGEKNIRDIDRADVVVANLDGADPDSGTAAEIGYAHGTGTPIVGYRTDRRSTGENEGLVVNLQVEYFIRVSGGSVVAADQYGGEWEADHHQLYASPDELEDRIVEALDRVRQSKTSSQPQ